MPPDGNPHRLAAFPWGKDGMPSSVSPGFVYTFLPLLWVIFLGGFGGRLKKKKKKSSYQHFAIVQKEALTEVPEEAFVV